MDDRRTHMAQNLNEATPVPVLRTFLAGVLMGMANLVPGISGGTMLVACGVYRRFIDAISSATRLKITRNTVLMLGLAGAGAGVSIVGLAGGITWALVEARWAMFALFIGLTLGGLPILWKMARPIGPDVIKGIVGGTLAMGALVFVQESGGSHAALSGPIGFVVGGAAGAGAMILPGISGAFLLLLLGQYEPILDAIHASASAARDGDTGALLAQMRVVVPVGIGVLLGIVGVANGLKWVIHRWERPTLGVLIGLLIAAPAGLYPFRAGVEPEIGETVKGRVVTEENLAEMRDPGNAKEWRQRSFTPTGGQIAGALALIGVGFAGTTGIARLGRGKDQET